MEFEELNLDTCTQRVANEGFPNIVIKEINETTPLVVSLLEQGDMMLIGEYKGQRKVVGHISAVASNIRKLLRTTAGLTYNVNSEETVSIDNITDYVEVFKWI